nr:sigma-70 family RNA polymerase sigma factor [Clostridiales bacterium]
MLEQEVTIELIRQAQDGCEPAKTKLIEANSPLIKSVIRRYRNKGVDYDDLYQLGCMGFLKAIRNFSVSFGVKFSTYAVPMIAGEVKRFLRDDGYIKVSRSVKSLAAKISYFICLFYTSPSPRDISGERWAAAGGK